MNARHDATLSLSDILATASASGAGCSLPHGRDVLIWGPIGNVKKALAAMGLGLDFSRTGKVQGIHDATGRRWGS